MAERRPKTVVCESRLDIRDLASCAAYLQGKEEGRTKSSVIAEAVAMAATYAEMYGGVSRLSSVESMEWLKKHGLGGSKEGRGFKDLLKQIQDEGEVAIASKTPDEDVIEVEEERPLW